MKFPKGMMLPVMCLTIASGLAQTAAKPGPSPAARARTLFAEGARLIDGGDYQTASEKINAGLKLDPKSAVGHFYSAEIEQKWGHMSTAEAEYKMSLKLDPNSKVADQATSALVDIRAATQGSAQSGQTTGWGGNPSQARPQPVQSSNAPTAPSDGPTFEEAQQFVLAKLGSCWSNLGGPASARSTSFDASFGSSTWSAKQVLDAMDTRGGVMATHTREDSFAPADMDLAMKIIGCRLILSCLRAACVSERVIEREGVAVSDENFHLGSVDLYFGSQDDALRASAALHRMLELSGAKKSAF